MRFVPTEIDGVTLIELDPIADSRGSFARNYCRQTLADAGVAFEIVQANLSFNTHVATLRGLHFQTAPHGEPKIVSCMQGRIWDVAVDIRPNSPTFKRWTGFELSPSLNRAVLLMEGIAHGFITLEPDSTIHYLMGAPYVAEAAQGLRWNDPALAIDWPIAPEIISDRDANFPLIPTPPKPPQP